MSPLFRAQIYLWGKNADQRELSLAGGGSAACQKLTKVMWLIGEPPLGLCPSLIFPLDLLGCHPKSEEPPLIRAFQLLFSKAAFKPRTNPFSF